MNFRRWLAALLTALILATGTLGYAPVFAEEDSEGGEPKEEPQDIYQSEPASKEEEPEHKEEEAKGEGTDAPEKTPIPTIPPEDSEDEENTPEPVLTPEPQETLEPVYTLEPEVTLPADATPTITPEPTPEAGVAHISIEDTSGLVVVPNMEVTFRFNVYNLKSLSYRINNAKGKKVASGKLSADASSVTLTPTKAGVYTLILTGKGVDGSEITAKATVTVSDPQQLVVSVTADHECCHAGDPTSFTLNIPKDIEVKNVIITADQDGAVFFETDGFRENVTVTPPLNKKVTDVTLTLRVEDVYDQVAEVSATIPCAVHDRETKRQWEATMAGVRKNGIWPQDLVAIALTQVGYKESKIDFGEKHGGGISAYTRYGDWAGMDYDEWCAMFVSFCLHYAGVSEENFARASNCQRWIEKLRKQDLYAARGAYTPKVGDIAFFEWQGDNRSDHVGIIYKLKTNSSGSVTGFYTIEGNSKGGAVTDNDYYKLSDSIVVGYGLVAQAYNNHIKGVLKQANPDGTGFREQDDPEATETVAPNTEIVVEQPAQVVNQPLRAEDDGVIVTASYEADAELPYGTQMTVHSVRAGDEGFDAYVDLLRESLTDEELAYARFIEVSFTDVNGQSVTPESPVRLNITNVEKLNASRALHAGTATIGGRDGIDLNGQVELYRGDDNSVFSFDQSEFSGVICTYVAGDLKYKKNAVEAESGDTTARLSYNPESKVPSGCVLSLREITPGSQEYQSCAARLGGVGSDEVMRFYEIGLSLNGLDIDPQGPVTVTIAAEQPCETVRVVGIPGGEALESKLTHRINGLSSVKFETEGTGIYALVFGN